MNNLVNEMLKEIIENSKVINEAGDYSEAYPQKGRPLRTPQPRILQTWGDPNGVDTPVLKQIADAMIGATTIEDRINKLNDFMNAKLGEEEAVPQAGPYMGGGIGVTISTIMYLEVFYALVTQFEAAPAGFLLESILAGSFNGKAITEVEGGSLPITDIILPAIRENKTNPDGSGDSQETYLANADPVTHYSLKLLSEGGVVKGSYTNLVKSFFFPDAGARPLEKLVYLVVEKTNITKVKTPDGAKIEGMDLVFHEFVITKDNWFEWIGPPKVGATGEPEEKTKDTEKRVKFTFDPKTKTRRFGVTDKEFPEDWAIKPLKKVFAVPGEGFKNPAKERDIAKLIEAGAVDVSDEVWQLNPEVEYLGDPITNISTLNMTHGSSAVSNIPGFGALLAPSSIPPEEEISAAIPPEEETLAPEPSVPMSLQEAIKIAGTTAGKEEKTAYLIPGEKYTAVLTLRGDTYIPRFGAFDKIYKGKTDADAEQFEVAKEHLKNLMNYETFDDYINAREGGYRDDRGFKDFLRAVPGFTQKGGAGGGGEQFLIHSSYHKAKKSVKGTLSLQAPKLKEVAEKYTEDLGVQIQSIYNCLDDLSRHVQNYFLGGKDIKLRRQEYGGGAVKAAQCVIDNMEEHIKKEEEEAAAETERAQRRGAQRRSSRQARQGNRPAFEESKKPIDLDKLIEQMINKKFN